ncbi:hypothetical protein SSX86_030149 [Deinandra increscens subsp. villosa]|uniref:Protein kinase domain-containing protein n=1 Tax=Deinandra increscens subsp. villosa TaxID=3103831 RepID=A0AAP0GKE1_9ASTR
MASTIKDKFAHLRIPLEVVVKATNNFHHDNIIGHGVPGTAYRGQLLQSKIFREITARRFDWKHGEGHLEFLRESTVLLDLEHTNLVSVIGFCDEKDEKIIVTRYEAKGNLGRYLNSPKLTWTQRLRVCVGVARALSYLHDVKGRDYSVIHCNINSDMILLDENWEAKLCGFEHSIKQVEHNKDEVSPCEHIGTMGCMDPEIEKTGGVTHKSDTYSFGVILFEVLCGRRAFIDDHENEANRFLVSLAKYHYENKSLQDILNVDLYDRMSPQSVLKCSKLAYSCLNEDRARRPNIDDIVNQLERAVELQLRYENIVSSFFFIIIFFLHCHS